MSLDTLLEAAEYIEWSANTEPRESASPVGEIMTYIKTEMADDEDEELQDEDGDSSLEFEDYSPESHRGDPEKEKRRAGGAGTRETHNKLEKNRRAHLKECFDLLKYQVPFIEDKKTSNLSILRGALKFIQNLKRKEKDLDRDHLILSTEKCRLRAKVAKLKFDLNQMNMEVDLTKWMPTQEQETNSISTASGAGSPILSDIEDDKHKKGHKRGRHSSKDKNPSSQLGNQVAMVKNIPVNIIKQPRQLAPAAPVPTMATHITAPVTQLLHQTLSKRQALQQQREKLAVSQGSKVNKTTSNPQSNQLLRQQLSFPVATQPLHYFSAGMNNPIASGNALKSNLLQATTTTMATRTTMTPHLAVAPRLAPALAAVNKSTTSQMSTLTALSQLTAVAGLGTAPSLSSSGITPSYSSILSTCSSSSQPRSTNQLITTVVTPSVQSLATMSAIKPILAPAPQSQYVPNHLLNSMIAQLPQNNTFFQGPTTQAGNPTGQTTLVSLAHMGMLTPMAVVPQLPQALHMTGLTAAQFNSIMSSPQILKQLPMLQQPILQQVQSGPVIGQPMGKPVVMVSLPNVVTSNTSTNYLTTTSTSYS